MIDGGTTTYHMCQALADRQLQVITNSFAIASHLVEHSQCSVIVPGGRVFRDSRLILDPFHSESFLDYRADTLFMGVGGLDETGATNDDALVIRSERDMIARVRDLVVLADSAKFGRNAGLFLCSLDRVRVIVSDESLSEDWQAFVREHGIDLVLV
jgi:DeoR family ulaG and ulaABCDEF operon transcriptional repressor